MPVWLWTNIFPRISLEVFNITFTSFRTIAFKIFSILSFSSLKRFSTKNQAAFALFLTFVHIYRYCNFCFQIPLPLRRCFIKINNQYLRSRPIYISHVNIQLGQFIQTDIKITWGIVSFKINHDFITLQIAQGSCLEFCWIGRAKIY